LLLQLQMTKLAIQYATSTSLTFAVESVTSFRARVIKNKVVKYKVSRLIKVSVTKRIVPRIN